MILWTNLSMQSTHWASQSMCDDKDTYKAILSDVQQGVLLAIYVRNLQMVKNLDIDSLTGRPS